MSDRLQELAVFVRTAESGSFSKAARELRLSQPSISRIVGDLETRLGVKLLLRTTRRVTVTDAGHAFLDRAKQIVHDLEAAEDAARGIDSLRGQIRVALPVTFAVREIIPRLPPFLAAHPLLRLELSMSDDRQDLVAEGIDIAIRLGQLPPSGFGARRLATGRRLLAAAPAYLARCGTPKTLAELADHDLIFGPGLAARQSWTFSHRGEPVPHELSARILVSSGEGMMACVRAGLGIAVVSEWMCAPDLEAGRAVEILQKYVMPPAEVHAVYPAGPRPSAKVRALVDHLDASLRTATASLQPDGLHPMLRP